MHPATCLPSILMLFVAAALPLAARSTPSPAADHYLAGCPITVTSPIAGDLIAAGCSVDVSAPVEGDAVVAAGNVRLGGAIRQGVYAAGGRVYLDAPVGRNVRIGGGSVELGPAAKIAGNVTLGAGEAVLRGTIAGRLYVGSGRVRIDGTVHGGVEVASGQVELGPNAQVMGGVRYGSPNELVRDPAARVEGTIERIASPAHGWSDAPRARMGRAAGWAWTVGLLVLAAIAASTAPGLVAQAAETVRRRWPVSLLTGFVLLVCVPVAVLIALITVIGIPLGLLTVALYLGAVLFGYVLAGGALGVMLLERLAPGRAGLTAWRVVAAVLGMLLVSLLGRTPWVGALVTLAALLLGIGALVLYLWSRARPAPTQA